MHPARLDKEKLMQECSVVRTRRGGPGGQHRNKVSSAVVITHEPTGVSGQASEKRSQHANHDQAVQRLRVNLAIAVRSKPGSENGDGPSSRSELWQQRSSGGRLNVNTGHDDFPALLVEALDRIESREYDVSAAAETLGVSTSQLVKFLKLQPEAFSIVNRQRETRGMHPLK